MSLLPCPRNFINYSLITTKKSPSLSSMWRAFFFKPFCLAHLDLILYGVQLSNGLIDRLVEFAFCFLGLLIIDEDTGVID